ncbi:MAG: ABC transporter ATP-binding protein [Lachnospiraceae bacterium]|nr:ABC transporter ATP-binding protein [Lachnospiraceae bacterium]
MITTTKNKPKYNTFQNVWWMLKNAWKDAKSVLFLCLCTVVLAIGLKLTQLFIAPMVLAKVEQSAPLSELIMTIILFTLALLFLQGLNSYMDSTTTWGRINLRSHLIARVFFKTLSTGYPNMLNTQIQKLKEKANSACGSNRAAAEHIWITLCNLATNLAGFLIYLMMLSNISSILILVIIATSVIGYLSSLRVNSWNHAHREEEGQYQKQARYIKEKAESVTLAKDIRIFGLSDWLIDVQNSILNLYLCFLTRRERIKLFASITDVIMNFLRNGIAYYYLIGLTLQGQLSASEFLLYFNAVGAFTSWITGILQECTTLHKESLDVSTVREYLELEEPFLFENGAPIPTATSYELRLENVSFRYPEAEKDTIQHMNLIIHPGEKLAIVGLNGAGKTTLVKLLCGLFDPTEGRVLLNGQDIRSFNRRDYYELFSAVFQDFCVLDITVAETVAQSISNIDTARVRDSLHKAGLTEKVADLPKGIDTHIGREIYEDGILLSGGQMQRLMLARALYKNGPLLFLDEPTAAVDPIAENDIYRKYNEMTEGKTSLFISHRLASTRFCDRILFLADGVIVEEGTHDELLAQNGAYAELFEIQSRYYQEGVSF